MDLRSYRQQREAARISFLADHPELWFDFDKMFFKEWQLARIPREHVIMVLKQHHLVAASTYWKDINLRECVGQARILREKRNG